MPTERVTITMSTAMLAALDARAEQDAPGAPNRSATAVRLLAHAMASRWGERTWYRVEARQEQRERAAAELRGAPWCAPLVDAIGERETLTVTELLAEAGQTEATGGRSRACYVLRRLGWEKG